jgi:hypothetical protein
MMNTTTIASAADFAPSEKFQTIDDFLRAKLTKKQALDQFRLADNQGQVIILGKELIVIYYPGQEQRAAFHYRRELIEPNKVDMAKGLARAGLNAAKNLMHKKPMTVHTEIENARLSTCNGCEQYDNGRCMTIKIESGEELKGCGCVMKVKAKLEGATCPQGKWNA